MTSSTTRCGLPPAPVLLFAVWTVLYHFFFFSRLPVRFLFPLFLGFVFAYALLAVRLHGPQWKSRRPDWVRALPLVGLSVLLAAVVLMLSRPDADDFDFLHRAVVQLGDLGSPILRTDTAHNVSALPPISTTHLLTSFELFLALSAHYASLDPVAVSQNCPAAVAAVLLPFVYFSLFRELRLSRRLSLTATVATIIFLLLDRAQHRSFGNFSLLRLWQGKVLLISVLLPYLILIQLRSQRRNRRETAYLALLVGICAVGLSGSALFLIPLESATALVALAFAHCLHARRHASRLFVLAVAVIYPLMLAGVVLLDPASRLADVSVWVDGWPPAWFQNAQLVLGDAGDLSRDALLLLVLPLTALSPALARVVRAFTFALLLLVLNPALGPLWLRCPSRSILALRLLAAASALRWAHSYRLRALAPRRGPRLFVHCRRRAVPDPHSYRVEDRSLDLSQGSVPVSIPSADPCVGAENAAAAEGAAGSCPRGRRGRIGSSRTINQIRDYEAVCHDASLSQCWPRE